MHQVCSSSSSSFINIMDKQDQQPTINETEQLQLEKDEHNLDLNLSLSIPSSTEKKKPACRWPPLIASEQEPVQEQHHHIEPAQEQQHQIRLPMPRGGIRIRRNRVLNPNDENVIYPPPFPWASNRYAKILTYDQIIEQGIHEITGELECKKCEKIVRAGYNLKIKFQEIGRFIILNKKDLCDRAPTRWDNPELQTCSYCKQPNSLKPVIPDDKRMINWLFLVLGEMVGSCTIDDLKFFCKYTENHRTGAKNRLVYLTYLDVCKQLDPSGPFYYDPNPNQRR